MTRSPGLFLPLSAIGALALFAGGVVVNYVFATKLEVVGVAQAATAATTTVGDRVTVTEQTVKHHDEALDDLKNSFNVVDENLRTLMIEQGIPHQKIKTKEKR